LVDVNFTSYSYLDLQIPKNSIIYCDPPYEGTTAYKDEFNHTEFWDWCRQKAKEGHIIFVSEYNAPNDFECVWQQEIVNTLNNTAKTAKVVEKLFTLNGFEKTKERGLF
jgi:DNA adenine methylase